MRLAAKWREPDPVILTCVGRGKWTVGYFTDIVGPSGRVGAAVYQEHGPFTKHDADRHARAVRSRSTRPKIYQERTEVLMELMGFSPQRGG